MSLARQMLRSHRSGFIAAFVAIFCGSALITASGVLLDSAQRGSAEPDRYATAPIVVGASQQISTREDIDRRLTERVRLPVSDVDTIEDVPGVRSAIGDVTVNAVLRTNDGTRPQEVHGWSSAQLVDGGLSDGRAPRRSDEVVLPADAGVAVGDTATLAVGGVASTYDVVGVGGPGQSQAYVPDARAQALAHDPDHVDAIAVVPDDGVATDDLEERLSAAMPSAVIATGDDRADVEFLEVGDARSVLSLVAGSFGGTMAAIVLLVVCSTLGLSIRQRRREFALLRAIAATPRQVSRLIGCEAALLASGAAVLGAIPGIGLSLWLRDALVDMGLVPRELTFTVGPLPVLAAMGLCVGAAWLAGVIAARRANRISPVEALGAAVVEPPRLGRARFIAGWTLIGGGIVAGLVLPLTIGGVAAGGSAAGSTLLLIIGVALVGPRLLTAATDLATRLGVDRTAPGWLAVANTRSNTRRLGTPTTLMAMAVALAAVQVFMLSTMESAAKRQVDDGFLADHVVVADDGVAPAVADDVRAVPGVTATSVAQTQVLVRYDEFGEPVTESYPAQGVTPGSLDKTMDLDVAEGDLSDLADGTVAVSQFAADTFGVSVGSSLAMRLGDGTRYEARVIATYERGLGFGDLTLPDDVVRKGTTSGLSDYVLLAGGDPDAVRAALAPYRELTLTDGESFAAAQLDGASADSSLNLLLNLALLAFVAIAVVNVLALATSARLRDFALLRLVGAKPRQVRSMMRNEAATIIGTAVVVGTLAAVPPLLGISFALTSSLLPTVSPLVYATILVATGVLGWCAIALPTRYALRTSPVAAMGVGE